ncbi:molecular chaperone DnaJ [uncultured Pseudomonas sp.]|uniref:molecular chaperone DnaJ n=1 Tax=uncultured Pseudomonas sp. TaxID=114707 RepID=UPI0025F50947|nr:molecular chaperone DnaJ [uncultured Pseudomonas sp.]
MSCWIRLGIEPTQDLDTIRLAYRSRLPTHHPETDPEGFQALRAAYEEAQRLAREHAEDAQAAQSNDEVAPDNEALDAFQALLEDSTRRYEPQAWLDYIGQLDELPLEQLDDLNWQLLHRLRHCGPIAYQCVRLLATRLGWAEQLLRLPPEEAQDVAAFLQRIEEPDPFDTRLIRDWSPAAQLETLWYFRSLGYYHQERPLFEYTQFADCHTCVGFPADEDLVSRLTLQFSQAGIGSRTLHARLQQQHEMAPDDVDVLYLLARQASALGAEEQALNGWLRLWREHRHPEAERWLLDLCAGYQPQRLPLLIQALDQQSLPHSWPEDLTDPAQACGCPAQSPQTLARWSEASRLKLEGFAATFIDWRLDGDDELPPLAWLLADQEDRLLQRRYWQAWTLQRGEAGLLRSLLDEPASGDPLDDLILEGFQRQAAQQLHWLEHSPVVRALVAFCASAHHGAVFPEALKQQALHPVCREWLRRMRVYSPQSLERLNEAFDMRRMFTVPFGMRVMNDMARHGIELPPMAEGAAQWDWHRQQLFMLATIAQPQRWLDMITPKLPSQMQYATEHPFYRTHRLLLSIPALFQENNALLRCLDERDPVQALMATPLHYLAYAFASTRLPGAVNLFECYQGSTDVLEEHPLGELLLCATLYHSPALDSEQRTWLRARLDTLGGSAAWVGTLRTGLIAGNVPRLPYKVIEREEKLDGKLLKTLVSAFNTLVKSAKPPRTVDLMRLQKAKDDADQDTGLRCAAMALLARTEGHLAAAAREPQAPSWAFWRLNSRISRSDFVAHCFVALMGGAVLTAVAKLPELWVVAVLLILTSVLRRLRDLGQGVPMLIGVLAICRFAPFAPAALMVVPGDKLANRYGPPPDDPAQLSEGLQVALRHLNAQ